MIRRIGITIVATLLAVFGIGHVRALVTHGQFGCAAASAQQDRDDGGTGASESDEASTEPEKAKTPPDIAGDWTGDVDDVVNGIRTFEVVIDQDGKKLSGTWSGAAVSGTFTGSINVAGAVKATLKIVAGCNIALVGLLVEPTELTGTYKWNCSKDKTFRHDHGTFDISD